MFANEFPTSWYLYIAAMVLGLLWLLEIARRGKR
jgi:hypothetical protein